MPYALVLHCNTQNGFISPEDLQGQKTLALFLQELIQKQDPALATHAPRAEELEAVYNSDSEATGV